MSVVIAACLAAGYTQGLCAAEAPFAAANTFVRRDLPTAVEMTLPEWATEAWRNYAAHIVASEAGGVPIADLVVACTMVRDVQRGWRPWSLHPGRWHGWGPPDEADRQAVIRALSGGCQDVPTYAYVGNLRDARYWYEVGIIRGPVDLYLGAGGAAVVGVPR